MEYSLCTALEIEHRLTPPKSPQTNGMVERFKGRIEEVLQSHHFRSGEEMETTQHRYAWLYNQQLPQSTLGSKSPLQAMKDWHKLKPESCSRNSRTTFRDVTQPGRYHVDGVSTSSSCNSFTDSLEAHRDLSPLDQGSGMQVADFQGLKDVVNLAIKEIDFVRKIDL